MGRRDREELNGKKKPEKRVRRIREENAMKSARRKDWKEGEEMGKKNGKQRLGIRRTGKKRLVVQQASLAFTLQTVLNVSDHPCVCAVKSVGAKVI